MDFLKKKIEKAAAKIDALEAGAAAYDQQKEVNKQQKQQQKQQQKHQQKTTTAATTVQYEDEDEEGVEYEDDQTGQAQGELQDDEEGEEEGDEEEEQEEEGQDLDGDGFPDDLGNEELHDGGTVFSKRIMHNLFHDEDEGVDPEDLEHDIIDEHVRSSFFPLLPQGQNTD